MGKNYIKRRIYDKIVVNGRPLFTLFDTGSWNSYITKEALKIAKLEPKNIKYSFPVGLGGKKRTIKEYAAVQGTLHGLPLIIHPFVIDELGTTNDGKKIELLFGLLAMEQWGVELDLKRKKLDLSHFTKEFQEL